MGLAVAVGRAGAAVGTGPAPSLGINILRLPVAVFTRPQAGVGWGQQPSRSWGRG